MIASVRGIVAAVTDDALIVHVGGVGFRVLVPKALLERVTRPGQEITLHTHLHVRENELTLYGTETEEELALFRLLQTVSGIGPKVALSILSSLPPEQFRAAIAQEDVTALARVPGIGPKTAKKLVFDLKDKVGAEVPAGGLAPAMAQADADLIAALTGLGYNVAEIQEALRHLPAEPLPLEERVRLALAYFVS
ncbi:MAG: Holliday junction branch migration protein RuvA [Anaerolineae bacterium]